jgi:hypothetical protein
MTRRTFLVCTGAVVLARPHAAFAQVQTKARRIGFLTPRSRPSLLGRSDEVIE